MNYSLVACIVLAFIIVCIVLMNVVVYKIMVDGVNLNGYRWPLLSSPYLGYYINLYWAGLPGEFTASDNGNMGGVSGVVTDTTTNTVSYTKTTSSVTKCPTITLGVYTVAAAQALLASVTPDASLSKSDLALIDAQNAAVAATNCGCVGVFITTPESGSTMLADPIMPLLINIGLVLSPPAVGRIKLIA